MSPIPTVPYGHIGNVVLPADCEKIQSVLIVNLETMLLNASTCMSIASKPFGEFFFGIFVSNCYDIKCNVVIIFI